MKNHLPKLALLSLGLVLPAKALAPGDEVAIEALAKADFVKGEAPVEWKADEVYIFECWATWCGPCIAAIPHIDGLFDKYHEQGLNIYGMNVWEDGKDKVVKFVEDKGDGMSYPVAYVGKGGEFEESWLKAAEVRGIPHAFVVKNGKLLFSSHPANLKDDLITALLAGGTEQEVAIQAIQDAEAKKEEASKWMQAFQTAAGQKDVEAMQGALDKLKEISPDAPYLGAMSLDIAVAGDDWAAAEELLATLAEKPQGAMSARNLAFKIDDAGEEIPNSLREALITCLESTTSSHFFDGPILARLHWALGHKDLALAAAKKSIEADVRVPKEVPTAFAASFEGETPQTLLDFRKALSASMQKQAEEKKAEAEKPESE